MYHKTEVAKTDLKSDDEESLSSSIGWSTEELGKYVKVTCHKFSVAPELMYSVAWTQNILFKKTALDFRFWARLHCSI